MASAASKIRRNAAANGIRTGLKPITLRSANGRDMGHAVLVRWLPRNPANSMPGNAYGVDADGQTYYTRSGRGWQRGPIPDAAAEVLAADLSIDLFNTYTNDRHVGWIGIQDCDATDGRSGGWFFQTPPSLQRSDFGTIHGTITTADIDAAIESLDADEIAPPVGLDRDEAEALVRETLARYVA